MAGASTKPLGRILISNDDGIDAIGITILREIAAGLSDDVWVIAPSDNRSGASRSITLRRDVVIDQLGPKTFKCSGTPSDCLIFGMAEILDQPPELVLTGINHGMNVADDILYSGTVAGAMEASLLGVPAIALSQRHGRDDPIDYAASRLFGDKVIRHILQLGIPPRTVMNVNFPKTNPAEIKGIKPAHLDRHKLGDVIIKGEAPNHYRLGPLNSASETSDGSDRAVLNDGWISLTPLMMDVTAHAMLDQLPVLDLSAVT
ncbi:MAG: 5'/3'-nucleotidase SurE [Proteobacteria bacterium]|jgi:5'-nucleotidase|nr:5'/3'-nucleotidase SurE [Pseudomonadota bacterium]MDA0960465.1 5'/3'-nucleotidase SurE [Pseudomonadota bacterium]NBP48355.1 5'/3'-nucleotidase SurE [Alphaproteobacteria bacterium]